MSMSTTVQTQVICDKAKTEECSDKHCGHATPTISGMLGVTGTCPGNMNVSVKIIEVLPDGDPNLAFRLRKT